MSNNICTDNPGGEDQLNSWGILSQGDSLGAKQDTMQWESKASTEMLKERDIVPWIAEGPNRGSKVSEDLGNYKDENIIPADVTWVFLKGC